MSSAHAKRDEDEQVKICMSWGCIRMASPRNLAYFFDRGEAVIPQSYRGYFDYK